MNNFFQKINELKNNFCQDSSIIEIAKTLKIYLKERELFDSYLNENNKNEKSIENQEYGLYELKILWKDLSKLYSKEDLLNKTEIEIFIYLNIEVGELIISSKLLEYFNTINHENETCEIIKRTVKIKQPLIIGIELNKDIENDLQTIITYEKETNLLHINLEQKEEN